MITSINSKNVVEYLDLYRAVEEYMKNHDSNGTQKDDPEFTGETLMEEDMVITSLDELFSYMQILRRLKPQLTRLPVDEPYFEINANTRSITIPSTFTGVSVQGDEIAESIYFIIDRFYDHMDLATQNIYIQYINAKGEQKVSIPPVVDIESEPGKIIFEWPLSSVVTAAAGNVQFSCRFYTYDDTEIDADGRGGKIVYSLSTLPQTINIKASQDFDLVHIAEEDNSIKEDNSTLMKNRLSNTPLYAGEMSAQAEVPVFWSDYSLPETMNLDKDAEGFTTVAVEYPVQAHNGDGGQITYYWKQADLDQNTVEPNYKAAIIATKDTAPVEGKVYYYAIYENAEEPDKPSGYKQCGAMEAFDEDLDYFEKVSICVIDEPGYYSAYAVNRVKTSTSEEQTPYIEKGEDEIVKACFVPGAKEPVAENINNTMILQFNDDTDCYEGLLVNGSVSPDDGKLTYKWYYSKDGEEFTEIEDATKASFLIQGESEAFYPKDEEGNIIKDIPIEEVQADDEDSMAVAKLTSMGNGVLGIDLDGNEAVFGPKVEENMASGDGYYKVEIINNLNKTSKSAESNVCRVTHAAIKPDVEVVNGIITEETKMARISLAEASKGIKVTASIPEFAGENRTDDDSITYQWYRYTTKTVKPEEQEQSLREDANVAASGRYVLKGDRALKNQTSDTLIIDDDMLSVSSIYFCRVVNTYNGTKAVRCSRFFEIYKPAE